MPEMIIQLRCDPASGRRDIVVKLHDDAELLPAEHEALHRQLVEKLVGAGVLKDGEGGRLIVERDGDSAGEARASEAHDERMSAGESG